MALDCHADLDPASVAAMDCGPDPLLSGILSTAWTGLQRHAAKSCPGRPRRIDKAVGASHRLPWVCLISWPRRRTRYAPEGRFAQTAATNQLTKRASARPRNQANPGASQRCAAACPDTTLLQAWLALEEPERPPRLLAAGGTRQGAHFCGGCDARPGGGRACALRELTRRSCLNGAPFGARSEFCDADPRPSIAAKSERSVGRHSNESPAGYRLPRREDLPPRGRWHG
jgi:hypothetical protein